MAPGQVFLQVLHFSRVTIMPPVLHTHISFCTVLEQLTALLIENTCVCMYQDCEDANQIELTQDSLKGGLCDRGNYTLRATVVGILVECVACVLNISVLQFF